MMDEELCEYVSTRFQQRTLDLIEQQNEIIEEYRGKGYTLTVRQLYYQNVARGYCDSGDKAYKRIQEAVTKGRMAGLIDWWSIEDRTRRVMGMRHHTSPAALMREMVWSYRTQKWRDQPVRFEVWIEKDALTGIINGVCSELDISYTALRGFTSLSEMWRAATQRFRRMLDRGQRVVILHMGDHDPSGLDATRDIIDKMETFGAAVEVRRIALNMEQVRALNPPSFEAKPTDSRSRAYIEEYGNEAWELDALDPEMLSALIRDEVMSERDADLWAAAEAAQEAERESLTAVADDWDAVQEWLATRGGD